MSSIKCSFTLLWIVILLHSSAAIVDYCSVNRFNSNTTYMQFTKEVSTMEYTEKGRFKGLHCCSKGYRSIEWYKDGRPYPWPSDLSNFILYPESANQTIYAQNAIKTDAGNYTCVVRNDTYTHHRRILLHVIDKFPSRPKTTFDATDQYVDVGEEARLFCEAYVGLVNLPDARNHISWTRKNENHSVTTNSRVHTEEVSREENQIIGLYLTIDKVVEEDFGEYKCRISNPDTSIDIDIWLRRKEVPADPTYNFIPWKKIAFIFAAIVLLSIKLFLLNLRYGLMLRVKWKNRFAPIEENDGKNHDVMVCFNQADEEIAKGVLMASLATIYKYSCTSQHVSTVTSAWIGELQSKAERSRRVVAVISPACFDNKWDVDNLCYGFEQLLSLNTPVIIVLLKPLPKLDLETKNANGLSLATLSAKCKLINLKTPIDSHFWMSLRLNLPPKRSCIQTINANENRMSLDSHESLEILV